MGGTDFGKLVPDQFVMTSHAIIAIAITEPHSAPDMMPMRVIEAQRGRGCFECFISLHTLSAPSNPAQPS